MKIATVQLGSLFRNFEVNLDVHIRLISELAESGCSYVVFPFLSLLGGDESLVRHTSENLLCAVIEQFSRLARKLHISFTLGAPIFCRDDNKFVAGAISFNYEGSYICHFHNPEFDYSIGDFLFGKQHVAIVLQPKDVENLCKKLYAERFKALIFCCNSQTTEYFDFFGALIEGPGKQVNIVYSDFTPLDAPGSDVFIFILNCGQVIKSTTVLCQHSVCVEFDEFYI